MSISTNIICYPCYPSFVGSWHYGRISCTNKYTTSSWFKVIIKGWITSDSICTISYITVIRYSIIIDNYATVIRSFTLEIAVVIKNACISSRYSQARSKVVIHQSVPVEGFDSIIHNDITTAP